MLGAWVSGEVAAPCEGRSLWVSVGDETRQRSQEDEPAQGKEEKKLQPQRGMLFTLLTANIQGQI